MNQKLEQNRAVRPYGPPLLSYYGYYFNGRGRPFMITIVGTNPTAAELPVSYPG